MARISLVKATGPPSSVGGALPNSSLWQQEGEEEVVEEEEEEEEEVYEYATRKSMTAGRRRRGRGAVHPWLKLWIMHQYGSIQHDTSHKTYHIIHCPCPLPFLLLCLRLTLEERSANSCFGCLQLWYMYMCTLTLLAGNVGHLFG